MTIAGKPAAAGASQLAHMLDDAYTVTVLTGAGISTESGIPDFRSPGGIWSKFRIIDYSEFMADEAARLEDWKRRFCMEDQLGVVKPNIGHEIIARWVRSGHCQTVITQNIDGLHQLAGTPEKAIIEIHGNARHASCTKCGLGHTIAECRKSISKTGRAPVCRKCGGIVKSDVVMFGQKMPEEETANAFRAAESCDLFIAIGTSLVVHPAASLPIAARRAGAKLVIINHEPTDMDPFADLLIHDGIGETFRCLAA